MIDGTLAADLTRAFQRYAFTIPRVITSRMPGSDHQPYYGYYFFAEADIHVAK